MVVRSSQDPDLTSERILWLSTSRYKHFQLKRRDEFGGAILAMTTVSQEGGKEVSPNIDPTSTQKLNDLKKNQGLGLGDHIVPLQGMSLLLIIEFHPNRVAAVGKSNNPLVYTIAK